MVAPNPNPVPSPDVDPADADPADASPPAETPASAVSDRKRAANRANAAKSTGPTSPEGKSRSRLNATRHGFRAELPVERCPQLEHVRDDDPNAFDDLHEAFVHDLQPRGAAEQLIVERLARAAWRLRRTEAAEIGLLDTAERSRVDNVIFRHLLARNAPHLRPHPNEMDATPVDKALAGHFTEGGKGGGLLTLMQYQARLEGQVRSCLRDLRLLREDRAAWAAQEDGAPEWSPPQRPRRKPRMGMRDLRQFLDDLTPQVCAEVERTKGAKENGPLAPQPEMQTPATEATPMPSSAPLPPTPTPESPAPPTPLAEASDVTAASPAPATNEATEVNQRAATNEATAGAKPCAPEVAVFKPVNAAAALPSAPTGATNEPTVAKLPAAVKSPAAPPGPDRSKQTLPRHLAGW